MNNEKSYISVLEMVAKDAFDFFMQEENYCSIELPPYFTFKTLLTEINKYLTQNRIKLDDNMIKHLKKIEDINFRLYSNKEGKYNWRPFEILNPLLYVCLLKEITSEKNWELLRIRFKELQNNNKIKCLSIPVKSNTKRKNKATQILKWWTDIEQESIRLSLEYNYLYHTDITDFYPSIYTHTIAWAIHEKTTAKGNRNNKILLGNIIDHYLQCMHHGQTNGIPQGSVLMDFIAEVILCYADKKLSESIEKENIQDYVILRYRDDYRIFVNNPVDGEKILKLLTEVLLDLGLKLNANKTRETKQVIVSSIKEDKYEWIFRMKDVKDIQKKLLILHNHAIEFPNSGSIMTALTKFYDNFHKIKGIKNPQVLISIVIDIAYNSPRTIPVCFSIISKLLKFISDKNESIEIIKKIHKKFLRLPNISLTEIWLQRISYPIDKELEYKDKLCKIVKGENITLWNIDYSGNNYDELKNIMNNVKIIDEKSLAEIKQIVKPNEINIFMY